MLYVGTYQQTHGSAPTMATANTQTDRNRSRMNFSADMAKRAEVDCPDCRGPGTAVIYKDRTPPHDLLAIECRVCGLYNDDFSDANTQSADTRQQAADDISHQGAGWYALTDGTRVRGQDTAIDKQVALYTATGGPPAPEPEDAPTPAPTNDTPPPNDNNNEDSTMATDDSRSELDTEENAAGDPPPTSRHTPTPEEPVNDTDESAVQLRTPGPAPDEQPRTEGPADDATDTSDEDTSDDEDHTCDVCGESFGNEGALASHESSHEDDDSDG